MTSYVEDDLSDDEIFFGKLTLKEIKKRLLPDHIKRRTVPEQSVTNMANEDDDVKIIEIHSEPEIISDDESGTVTKYPASKQKENITNESTDDSFLKLEKAVSKLCVSPNASSNFNNTAEVVNFVLNNMSPKKTIINHENLTSSNSFCNDNNNISIILPCENIDMEKVDVTKNCLVEDTAKLLINVPHQNQAIHKEDLNYKTNSDSNHNVSIKINNNESDTQHYKFETSPIIETKNVIIEPNKTPIKEDMKIVQQEINEHSAKDKTPLKKDLLKTPVTMTGMKKNLFKTPKNVATDKKLPLSATKSLRINTAYQHVMSPVAYYIKHSSQVPLVRKVTPKKPLPPSTSIPRPLKNNPEKKESNKENVQLQSVVYRSAKKTEVIPVTNKTIPKSQWAKKLTASEIVVRKHTNKNIMQNKTPISSQEDSIADLSLIQRAEVSIQIEKPAFKS